ncbi:MAG: transposase [bacterium]|nr:transposase [bacterium]
MDLEAPDHTTLSRRSQSLNVGEGEWAAAKHGGRGRRGWKKLHLGVDRTGGIVAQALSRGSADDAKAALALIDSIEADIESLTADTTYDTVAIYDASTARGTEVVIPPSRSATGSRQRRSQSSARDRTIMRVKEIGRGQWKKESGYPHQARVENTLFRYKSILRDRLRARHPESQKAEAVIACNLLNRLASLRMPESFALGS